MSLTTIGPSGRYLHRVARPGQWLPGDAIIALAIATSALLLRIPFRSRYLVNWDAVQFALGTQSFDIVHHQPHPPGYIGYIGAGKLLNQFTGDPNTSLVLMSMVAGSIATIAIYLLARQFLGRALSVAVAILFAVSPVTWYYSEVALTYTPGVALALLFLLAAYRGRHERSAPALVASSLALAALGAVRQTDMVFLLPVWLWAVWQGGARVVAMNAAVLLAATLAWLVPLLILAGGPATYLHESLLLAEASGGPTNVFSGSPAGLLQNLAMVTVGIVAGLNLALLVLLVGWRDCLVAWRGLDRESRWFFTLWLVPALSTYLLVHTGQLGYVLTILPVGFLFTGMAIQVLLRRTAMPRMSTSLAGGLGAAMLATSAAMFIWLPGAALTWAESNGHERLAANARQYSISDSDDYWEAAITFIREHDPAHSVVLTEPGGPRSNPAFRHLSYYLPEYRVHAIGFDEHGEYGLLFGANSHTASYSLEAFDHSGQVLWLGTGVDTIIVPDADVAARLDAILPINIVRLLDHRDVVVAPVPRGAVLSFEEGANGPMIGLLPLATRRVPGPASLP